MQLNAQRGALGYDMDVPWISRDKVHVEVSYKVTNLSDQTAAFTLIFSNPQLKVIGYTPHVLGSAAPR